MSADNAGIQTTLIRFASDMGFTLSEIRVFLNGLRTSAPVGPRWRKLAHRKIAEVERTIKQSLLLKSLFQHLLQCRCAPLQMCVERLSLSGNLKRISHYRDRNKAAKSQLRRDGVLAG